MTNQPGDDDRNAEVAIPEPPELLAVPADTSYEIELDERPQVPAAPVYADISPPEGARLPIIPAHLQSLDGIKAAGKRHAGRQAHRAGYHGVRAPKYLLLALWWAVIGVFRLAGRQIYWWQHLEAHSLRSLAVAAGDTREYMKLHKESKEVRKVRGGILAAEVLAIALAAVLLAKYAPWWAWLTVGALALPVLAHTGRPADKPIVTPAQVVPRFRVLNADTVIRAYNAAGLSHPDKPGQQLQFGTRMARDGDGTRVVVDLPHGKGLKDAIDAREKIASGLDVTESQVFIRRDPTSYRRHTLWVADRDPLAVPVGRTPLLACKPTDIWRQAPMGLDERGQLVTVPLMWNSLLVSALPRAGKTFAARLLALFCALDPYCKLSVFDAKGSPDWRKFSLVADSCAYGLTPTRAGKPPEILLSTLEDLKADAQDRYTRLSEMPTDVCPEGKLTREMARDPRFRMPVRVLVLEEFQEYYELGPISKDIAELLQYLVKVAPGAGIILLCSTQKPSGIGGGGELGQRFTGFRDNFSIRFGLRTSSWQVSEMCLGQGCLLRGPGHLHAAAAIQGRRHPARRLGCQPDRADLPGRRPGRRADPDRGAGHPGPRRNPVRHGARRERPRGARRPGRRARRVRRRPGPALGRARRTARGALPRPLGRSDRRLGERRGTRQGRGRQGREDGRPEPSGLPPRRRRGRGPAMTLLPGSARATSADLRERPRALPAATRSPDLTRQVAGSGTSPDAAGRRTPWG